MTNMTLEFQSKIKAVCNNSELDSDWLKADNSHHFFLSHVTACITCQKVSFTKFK